MSISEETAEVLRALAPVLKERGARWYLFGAQAAIVWGGPRFSQDVDVTVTVPESEIDDYIDAMHRYGFDVIPAHRAHIRETHVIRFTHRATEMPVDVVLAGPGLEDEFLRRSVPVDVEGMTVPVISPEDLIITKVLAGRPTDMQDVRAVLRAQRDVLDVTRIRDVLSLLEQALTRGDLLPEFEKAWQATQP